MNKTHLIFKHEFLETIKRIGYLALTFTLPVLAFLGIVVIDLVAGDSEETDQSIQPAGYVDQAGFITTAPSPHFDWLTRFDSEEEATQALINGEVKDYFVIAEDYVASGKVRRFTLEKEMMTPPVKSAVFKSFLTVNLLTDKVPAETIISVTTPMDLQVTRLNELGEPSVEQSNIGNIVIPAVFSMLLVFSYMFGASALIGGLGEEKESRLIEVLFSSVSIRQLLVGKVLALGLAGLLQVLVWLASAPLLLNLASARFGGFLNDIQIPNNFLLLGIVYFILGYLLFAVLSVGIGAISQNAREGNQLSMFYLLTSLVPLWLLSLYMAFPNSNIWVALTIFPPTAPVQTLLRMGISDIPTWQILASIVALIFSIIAGLFLCIKIFRVYMLMYGTRPRLSEIVRSLINA
jgi:ABC-2 type transport system permease protein